MKGKSLRIFRASLLILLSVLLNCSCSRNSEKYIYKYEYYKNGPDLVSERYYKNDTLKYAINRRNKQIYDSTVYKYNLDSIYITEYRACSNEDSDMYYSLPEHWVQESNYTINDEYRFFVDKYCLMSEYYSKLLSYLNMYEIKEVQIGNENISFKLKPNDFLTNNTILNSIDLYVVSNVVYSIHYHYLNPKNNKTNIENIDINTDMVQSDYWQFFDYKDGLLQSVRELWSDTWQDNRIDHREYVYKYGKENALHYVEM